MQNAFIDGKIFFEKKNHWWKLEIHAFKKLHCHFQSQTWNFYIV